MTLEEALKAATRGYKVAPMCKKGFYVYHHPDMGYRRITVNKHTGFTTYCDQDFVPSPYEEMMVWEIYSKNPLTVVKNWFKRVFEKTSNALADPA